MFTRRDLLRRGLQGSTLIALAPTVPGFLARTARAAEPQRDGRIVVVVQLDGGNDGINTVVSYADEGYAKYRKALLLPKNSLVKVNDQVGLHSSLRDAGKLLEAGKLAIIQGVGYPNPNRSHFESMAIWQSARFDPEEQASQGWLGLGLDESPQAKTGSTASLFLGSGALPPALRGRRSVASSLERLEDFALEPELDPRSASGSGSLTEGDLAAFVRKSSLDAYATADKLTSLAKAKNDKSTYPATNLGNHLKIVSQLVKSGFEARVYYTTQGSYDTHAGQLQTHQQLLFELGDAIKAFVDDMTAAGMGDRVVVLCFSEFGRRVAENSSAGTDHGTSGPVFLAGSKVKGGLIGATPSLGDLDGGDLKMSVDFRRVYASILKDWLGLPAKSALAGEFEPMPLFSV